VVALAADQRAAHGRLVGELALLRVRLGRADDRELLRLAGLLVLDRDDGPDLDGVGRDVLGVDDLRRAQALLELRDPLLEHHLLVLCVVVLGVLRDVAELAGLLDALGPLAPAGGLQLLQLFLQPLEPFGGQDDVSCHGGLVSVARRRQKTPLGAGDTTAWWAMRAGQYSARLRRSRKAPEAREDGTPPRHARRAADD